MYYLTDYTAPKAWVCAVTFIACMNWIDSNSQVGDGAAVESCRDQPVGFLALPAFSE